MSDAQDGSRYRFSVDVNPDWATSAEPPEEHLGDTLRNLACQDLGELYNYDESRVPWIHVIGGHLEVSVLLQLGWSHDLRLIITRLIVGSSPTEVTSKTLRSIPLASILAQFIEDYELSGELSWPDDWNETYHEAAGDPVDKWLVHRMLKQRLPQYAIESSAGQRTGAGADPDGLQRFAATYEGFLESSPHNAMSATARALHISRATANRRAKECRARGLLPARASP